MTWVRFAFVAVLVAGCGASPSASSALATPSALLPAATLDPDSPYGTTREEFLLRAKACVEDRGYPATLDLRQASIEFALGDDARAAEARVALEDCMKAIDPARLEPPPELTEAQLTAWYVYKLREADCLREAGFSPPEAPPLRVFIDTNGKWDPFASLLGAGGPAPLAVQQNCENVEGQPSFLGW